MTARKQSCRVELHMHNGHGHVELVGKFVRAGDACMVASVMAEKAGETIPECTWSYVVSGPHIGTSRYNASYRRKEPSSAWLPEVKP